GDAAPSGVRPRRGPGRLGSCLPGRDRDLRRKGSEHGNGGDGAGWVVVKYDRPREANPGAGLIRQGQHEVYQTGAGSGGTKSRLDTGPPAIRRCNQVVRPRDTLAIDPTGPKGSGR